MLCGIEKTKEALAYFRRLTQEAGFTNLHLQATIFSEGAVNVSGVDSNREGSTKDMVLLLGFDSVTHYQFVRFADCSKSYPEILENVKSEWKRIREEYSVPLITVNSWNEWTEMSYLERMATAILKP